MHCDPIRSWVNSEVAELPSIRDSLWLELWTCRTNSDIPYQWYGDNGDALFSILRNDQEIWIQIIEATPRCEYLPEIVFFYAAKEILANFVLVMAAACQRFPSRHKRVDIELTSSRDCVTTGLRKIRKHYVTWYTCFPATVSRLGRTGICSVRTDVYFSVEHASKNAHSLALGGLCGWLGMATKRFLVCGTASYVWRGRVCQVLEKWQSHFRLDCEKRSD